MNVMNPRVTVMTFNLWGNQYLSERTSNLTQVLNTLSPDILLLQEVTSENLEIVRLSLPNHNHIEQDGYWKTESNIFWNRNFFDLINFGYISFDHLEYPGRGVFWVRLCLSSDSNAQFVVSTSHFPWAGCEEEIMTGINQRIQCSKAVLESLGSILKPNEPVVFTGDLNDDFHPIRILRGDPTLSSLSLIDVFELLDLPPQITHPVRPSEPREEMRVSHFYGILMTSFP
jgi:endonuclease/exonuclease/phosphatase family metal-dependent hydrolase